MVPRSRPDRLIGSFERLERLSRNRCSSSTPPSAPFLSFHPEFESARGCSSAHVQLRSHRIVHYSQATSRESEKPIPNSGELAMEECPREHPGRAFFAIRGGAFHPALRASLKSRGKYHFPP